MLLAIYFIEIGYFSALFFFPVFDHVQRGRKVCCSMQVCPSSKKGEIVAD